MNGMTTFTSDKESLSDILSTISKGGYQLPEFQRSWVWDDARIISLLASVSLSYPIGAVMMLENGNPEVKFKARPIEGVDLTSQVIPERFILDGQQRLTSLFQSMYIGKPVKTKDIRKREIFRWYYIDILKALDPDFDREEAILSIPEDRKIKNFRKEIIKDYSSAEKEYEEMVFPIARMLNCSEWRASFNEYWGYNKDHVRLFDDFERKVIKRFEQYQIPVIKLLKETPKVAVCQVFEKVNTGGVSLSVFELVTAGFAAEGFNLREDWEGELDKRGRKLPGKLGRKDHLHNYRVLRSVGADELLQAITLLNTYRRKQNEPEVSVSCKRAEILKLSLNDYLNNVELATEGFVSAAKFLFQQKIFTNRDLPYSTQIVPLAAILAQLSTKAKYDLVRQKIARWYWCGVFGELYGSAVETRFAKDIVEVLAWIDGGDEPSTIKECNFVSERLETLRSRNSAAYKGIFTLLLKNGCMDFISGVPIESDKYFEDKIDIHHIFPQDWCKKNGIDPMSYDSIINKTALSFQTNRIIGGSAPSVYLKKLREQVQGLSVSRQNEILSSHAIDSKTINEDNYYEFFNFRRESLLSQIEDVTGKRIPREQISLNYEVDEDFDTADEED